MLLTLKNAYEDVRKFACKKTVRKFAEIQFEEIGDVVCRQRVKLQQICQRNQSYHCISDCRWLPAVLYCFAYKNHCQSYITLARSPMLPTFQVAEGFALLTTTASSSLRFTAPLLAAEHLILVAGSQVWNCLPPEVTQCRLWRPSALNSRRSSSRNHILTFS